MNTQTKKPFIARKDAVPSMSNFQSLSNFPPLGSAVKPAKPVLDFKKTVTAPSQPPAAIPKAQAPKSTQATTQTQTAVVTRPKKHVSYTRYGDDFPEDYDGPPEEDFDDEEEEEEEEEECEDIVSTRRRGDRGIW